MYIDASHGFNMIDIISKPDCKDFEGLFANLPGEHLVNPSKGVVRTLLRSHPERPLILCGHGDPGGLYNKDWNGYVIDSNIVDMLRKQQCIIGVWCYASEFADKYGLKGFFTSMFISTEEESIYEQRPGTAEDITNENKLFCKRLNRCIRENSWINDWPRELCRKANIMKPFVRFNYEALAVYD